VSEGKHFADPKQRNFAARGSRLNVSEVLSEARSRTYFRILDLSQRITSRKQRSDFTNPYSVLGEMKMAQWEDRRTLTKRLVKRVRGITEHAYRHVPYYRRLYKRLGVDPQKISSLDYFSKIPVLRKEEIRAAGGEFLAENADRKRILRDATMGSTGDPLSYYHDYGWELRRLGSKWLLDSYFGAGPQSRYFRIVNEAPSVSQPQARKRTLHGLRSVLGPVKYERDLPLSYLELTNDGVRGFLEQLRKFGPLYGAASPTQLMSLCELLSSQALQMPRLQAMISGSEILLDSERKSFEEVLGCPIFNRYGSREFFGAMAGECSYHTGMHVNLELVLIEVVDDDSQPCQGELGNIIVTDLHNRSMPFIRYMIGDVGSLGGDCNCGRTFPILGKVMGRQGDWVLNHNLARIPVLELTIQATGLADQIRYFQFRQVRPGQLIMRVVPNQLWDYHFVKQRIDTIGKHNSIDIEIEVISELRTYPSGKRRLLLN